MPVELGIISDTETDPTDMKSLLVLDEIVLTIQQQSQVVVHAGDITKTGTMEQLRAFLKATSKISIPTVCVLGNRDFRNSQDNEIVATLKREGVHVLEQEYVTLDVNGQQVVFYGFSGYLGDEAEKRIEAITDPIAKAAAYNQATELRFLNQITNILPKLQRLEIPIVLVTHYPPVGATVSNEKIISYPFFSQTIVDTVENFSNIVLWAHGHTHGGKSGPGVPEGFTPRTQIPVMNAAASLLIREGESPVVRRGI